MEEFPFYIIFIITSFIFIFVYLLMIKMHAKEPFIRQGYFKVVFIQIIYEFIITILLLITPIILIIYYFIQDNDSINKNKFLIFFPILFNFCSMNIIFYNILTLIHLTFKSQNSENYSTDLESTNMTRDISNDSISFQKTSFKTIHLLSLFFTLIHSIIYFYILFSTKEKFEIQLLFLFYVYIKEINPLFILIFIPNFIYLLLSFPYLYKSRNTEKISESIRLKNYSIYCFLSSLFSLIFPLAIFIYKIFENIKFIIYLIVLVYLIFSSRFRINCYYVQTILMNKGKTILDKFRFAIAILFKNKTIPKPNFVDLNSNYIYHSLANINDFVKDIEKNSLYNNNVISDTRNFSISVTASISQ